MPPLEFAFGGSVERWRLVLESIRMATFHWTAIIYKKTKTRKLHLGGFYYTTTTYTPSILHLTLTHCNLLIINTLISVRYYKFYLHTTYTPHMLPHGTSTGGQYHSIGKQKSLLLRLIFLRPSGVQSTEYDKIDCEAAGGVCKMYAGECKILWNHLTLLKHLYINLLRIKSVRWQ